MSKNYNEKYHIYENIDSRNFDDLNERTGKDRIDLSIKSKSLIDLEMLSLSGGTDVSDLRSLSGVLANIAPDISDEELANDYLSKYYLQSVENIDFISEKNKRLTPLIKIDENVDKFRIRHIHRRRENVYTENIEFISKDQIKRDTFKPFSDISKFNPKIYLLNGQDGGMFNFEYTDSFEFESYYLGIVDPIGTRIKTLQIDRYKSRTSRSNKNQKELGYFLGLSCNFETGANSDKVSDYSEITSVSGKKRGTNLIQDFIVLSEKMSISSLKGVPFDDLNQRESLGYTEGLIRRNCRPIPAPDLRTNLVGESYFDDTHDYQEMFRNENATKESDMLSAESSMIFRNQFFGGGNSFIGSHAESMTAGFVYETTTIGNTTLGTDSIAFGGLIKS